jgi:hypothetical protein
VTLTALLSQSATIVRRSPSGTTDDYGNDIPDETTEDVECYLEQRQRDEDDLSGEVSESEYLLIVPAGTVLDTGDEVIVNELAYEMVGAPWEAWNARTGQVGHIEATVKRVAGEDDAS